MTKIILDWECDDPNDKIFSRTTWNCSGHFDQSLRTKIKYLIFGYHPTIRNLEGTIKIHILGNFSRAKINSDTDDFFDELHWTLIHELCHKLG
jgi:hypothetical protein